PRAAGAPSRRHRAPACRWSSPCSRRELPRQVASESAWPLARPPPYEAASNRPAAKYFLGRRFALRATPRRRATARSSLARALSNASCSVAATASTCTAGRRGCLTSSAQRIAGPPLGPFSSVTVARAMVGSTTSEASAVFRASATRARVASPTRVRNSIFMVVMDLLSRTDGSSFTSWDNATRVPLPDVNDLWSLGSGSSTGSEAPMPQRCDLSPGRGLPRGRLKCVAMPFPSGYPGDLERAVTLRDGSVVRIRPIRPDDAPSLQALHSRLSHDSAYQRFFAI